MTEGIRLLIVISYFWVTLECEFLKKKRLFWEATILSKCFWLVLRSILAFIDCNTTYVLYAFGFWIWNNFKHRKIVSPTHIAFFGAVPGDRLRDQSNPQFFKVYCRLLKHIKFYKCFFILHIYIYKKMSLSKKMH